MHVFDLIHELYVVTGSFNVPSYSLILHQPNTGSNPRILSGLWVFFSDYPGGKVTLCFRVIVLTFVVRRYLFFFLW